jgi:hypothetical protein
VVQASSRLVVQTRLGCDDEGIFLFHRLQQSARGHAFVSDGLEAMMCLGWAVGWEEATFSGEQEESSALYHRVR